MPAGLETDSPLIIAGERANLLFVVQGLVVSLSAIQRGLGL